VTAPSGPWSMWGVERVAASFGRGNTSVVETGMTSVGGEPVIDAAAGTGVDVSNKGERGASEAGAVGEQADRISVRKRIVRIELFIFA